MILARHTSPDQALTLIAEQCGGDFQVGFEGMPWHTHGDILARIAGMEERAAVERFIDELVHGQRVIALLRKDGALIDVWISDDPAKDAAYPQPGEMLEFRTWDGTRVSPPCDLRR